MSSSPDLGRLRWRCRRGTKELDMLFERHLAQLAPEPDPGHLRLLDVLLDQEDDALQRWLICGETVEIPELAGICSRIRASCMPVQGAAETGSSPRSCLDPGAGDSAKASGSSRS